MRKRLLWVGDAGCDSGFARCTHAILDTVSKTFDTTVLGINYRGYPHAHPYPMFPCWAGGDMLGTRMIRERILEDKPDIVLLQNDPWNVPLYFNELRDRKNAKDPFAWLPPMVGAIAIDSKNARGHLLNKLRHAIFWTDFGAKEAVLGGMKGPSGNVIGLGVELDKFYPGSKLLARKRLELPEKCLDAFIVGNVNRNQPRKRIDLTMKIFAEWYHSSSADAYLYLHVCPTGDVGIDVEQMGRYLRISDRLIISQPEVWKGFSDELVRATYQAIDVQINTATGEGWGLTTLEGMACGIPQIVPNFAALGEWTEGAAIRIPVREEFVPMPMNQLGGVIDVREAVAALDVLHEFPHIWTQTRENGLKLATDPRFDWREIGASYNRVLENILDEGKREAPGKVEDASSHEKPVLQDEGRG